MAERVECCEDTREIALLNFTRPFEPHDLKIRHLTQIRDRLFHLSGEVALNLLGAPRVGLRNYEVNSFVELQLNVFQHEEHLGCVTSRAEHDHKRLLTELALFSGPISGEHYEGAVREEGVKPEHSLI